MDLAFLLSQIKDLLAELNSYRPLDATTEARVMQKLRLDWNYHSNHLEGGQLTYGETKALLLFGITADNKPLIDHLEVQGHDEAIHFIEDMIKENYPMNEVFIRDLHQLILKKPYKKPSITPDGIPSQRTINIGKYKETPNHVRTQTGEMFYFASPEETPAKMNDLMDWYNLQKEDKEVEPIAFAAEFHYRFIVIHPFDDGNGRMARLLMNFILMQYGLPPVVVRTDDKENYFNVLQQADAGIHTPFIEYMAKGLLRSLEVMVKGAKGKSIEEPNDIAKEIALLKQSLKQKDNKVELLLNNKTLNIWAEQTLPVMMKQFVLMCEQFDGLYAEIYYELVLYIDVVNPKNLKKGREVIGEYYLNKNDVFNNNVSYVIQLSLLYCKEMQDETKLLDIKTTFKTFILGGINTFSYDILLKINIEHGTYTIYGQKSNRTLTKLYHQSPSEEEFAYILKEEARLHLDFIKGETEDGVQIKFL